MATSASTTSVVTLVSTALAAVLPAVGLTSFTSPAEAILIAVAGAAGIGHVALSRGQTTALDHVAGVVDDVAKAVLSVPTSAVSAVAKTASKPAAPASPAPPAPPVA